MDDVDDEVRDRAAFNLKLLNDEPLADTFVRDGETVPRSSMPPFLSANRIRSCTASTFSLDALETRLAAYVADTESSIAPFDFASVPKVSKEQALEAARRKHNSLDLAQSAR